MSGIYKDIPLAYMFMYFYYYYNYFHKIISKYIEKDERSETLTNYENTWLSKKYYYHILKTNAYYERYICIYSLTKDDVVIHK